MQLMIYALALRLSTGAHLFRQRFMLMVSGTKQRGMAFNVHPLAMTPRNFLSPVPVLISDKTPRANSI